MNFLLIAIGGFFGSILRYYISVKTKHLMGTWIANITGSILLGITVHFHLVGDLTETLWSLIGVGFCGAYTTFSTFGNETLMLILEKRFVLAAGYVSSSLALSLFFVYLLLVIM